MTVPRPPLDRFWEKVNKNGPEFRDLGPCWIWTASCWPSGYGKFRTGSAGSKMAVAHRYAYESIVGVIPEGLTLDHLCRVRGCVNPIHLEPVTHRVNVFRGGAPPPPHAIKTHCPAGHPYNEVHTYICSQGFRHCITCIQTRKKIGRAQGKPW